MSPNLGSKCGVTPGDIHSFKVKTGIDKILIWVQIVFILLQVCPWRTLDLHNTFGHPSNPRLLFYIFTQSGTPQICPNIEATLASREILYTGGWLPLHDPYLGLFLRCFRQINAFTDSIGFQMRITIIVTLWKNSREILVSFLNVNGRTDWEYHVWLFKKYFPSFLEPKNY